MFDLGFSDIKNMNKTITQYCSQYTKLVHHKEVIEKRGLNKTILNELFLDLHSCKAISIGLGNDSLAKEIHRLETFVLKTNKFGQAEVRMLMSQLDRITFKLKRRLTSQKIDLKDYFKQLAENVGKISKKQVKASYKFSGSDINKWESRLLRELITPIVINSIDHGIETQKEREKAGKALVGKINIEIISSETDLKVHVKDDGRGIGFSEPSDVSLLSGRKLGLRFVNWQVEEMYGEVKYNSEEKVGSEVNFFVKRIYNHFYAA